MASQIGLVSRLIGGALFCAAILSSCGTYCPGMRTKLIMPDGRMLEVWTEWSMILRRAMQSASVVRTIHVFMLAVCFLASAQKTIAQSNSGVPWSDEPVVGTGAPYAQLQPGIWPALFGEAYVEGDSGICLACNQAGTWKAYLRTASGAMREVGTYVETVHSRLPFSPPVSSGSFVVEEVTYSGSTTTSHFVSSGTLWIPSTGQYAHLSGFVVESQVQMTTPATSTWTVGVLAIHRTHSNVADAESASYGMISRSKSADAIKSELVAIRRPSVEDGGEIEPKPDWDGYETCASNAELRKDIAVDNAWRDLQHELNSITAFSVGEQWGTWGGAIGFGGGGLIGLFCGNLPGAGIGAGFGTVAGGLIGAGLGATVGVEQATVSAWDTYYRDVEDALYAYWADLADCRERHNIPAEH